MNLIIKKILKWLGIIVVILLIAFLAFTWYFSTHEKEVRTAWMGAWYKMLIAPEMRAQEKLEAMRKVDNVGGKTPEETLDMYIAVLKKGDVKMAVKLYEVAVQEKQTRDFKEVDLNKVVEWNENVKKLGKAETWPNGTYSIGYKEVAKEDVSTTTIILGQAVSGTIKKGSTTTIEKIFVKNQYTNVWKMLQ
jgi:hypothetical protein